MLKDRCEAMNCVCMNTYNVIAISVNGGGKAGHGQPPGSHDSHVNMASPSQISVSDFTRHILDKIVHFKIIKLDESLFVWIGTNPVLSNMAVAMPAKYVSRSS